jgi:hypothetical protein
LSGKDPSYEEFDQVYQEFKKIPLSSDKQRANSSKLIYLLGEAKQKLSLVSDMAPEAKAA